MLDSPAVPTRDSLLMSMADIAQLAGVRRPVVTTWRRRYADFPAAVFEGGAKPLFSAREVCDWLVRTGRAEQDSVELDLCLHAFSTVGEGLPPRDLIAVVTSLVCLVAVDGEPLADATPHELRDRAEELDPEDMFLLTEIRSLPESSRLLLSLVDELIEAAWGVPGAFEHLLTGRGRFGVRDLAACRPEPELSLLVAKLTGAVERAGHSASLTVADPAAGAGDLLIPLLGLLPESCAPVVRAADSDAYLARLLRRRLIVHGVPIDDQDVSIGLELAEESEDTAEAPDAIVTQIPYQPAENRSAMAVLDRIDDIAVRLAESSTGVVWGPADVLTGPLSQYSPEERARAKLLASGLVEAVIRLPGGMLPFRPGYETALWVLSPVRRSPLRGRVLVADVSNAQLTTAVVDALVTDVVTWRRAGHRPVEHTRTHCAEVEVADLVEAGGPLVVPRLPTVRERRTEVPRTVARVAELESTLARLADARQTRRPRVRTGMVQAQPTVPRLVSIGSLIKAGTVSMVRGARLDPRDIGAQGTHRVIGPEDLGSSNAVPGRWIDRAVLAQRYPRATLTEPGDVLVTLSPVPTVMVDDDGFSVVEFPVRALRISAKGRARLTPRLLAALLTAAAAHRSDGAVRAPRRLEEWRIPVLDVQTVRETDRMLATLAERRAIAQQELAAVDALTEIAVTGLTNGTLTIQP